MVSWRGAKRAEGALAEELGRGEELLRGERVQRASRDEIARLELCRPLGHPFTSTWKRHMRQEQESALGVCRICGPGEECARQPREVCDGRLVALEKAFESRPSDRRGVRLGRFDFGRELDLGERCAKPTPRFVERIFSGLGIELGPLRERSRAEVLPEERGGCSGRREVVDRAVEIRAGERRAEGDEGLPALGTLRRGERARGVDRSLSPSDTMLGECMKARQRETGLGWGLGVRDEGERRLGREHVSGIREHAMTRDARIGGFRERPLRPLCGACEDGRRQARGVLLEGGGGALGGEALALQHAQRLFGPELGSVTRSGESARDVVVGAVEELQG